MKLIKQISVFVENKSGRLSDILNVIGKNGIDISALSIADTTDFGIVRMIVNDPDKAAEILKSNNLVVKVTDVIALAVADKPGGLAGEIEKLYEIEDYIQYKIPRAEIPEIEEKEIDKMAVILQSNNMPAIKVDKSEKINQEITRIRINGGKKSKMRPGDILGAISSIDGVRGEDIGIIDIQDTCSYVEIFGEKGQLVMDALQHTKIKGKIYTAKKVSFHTMF